MLYALSVGYFLNLTMDFVIPQNKWCFACKIKFLVLLMSYNYSMVCCFCFDSPGKKQQVRLLFLCRAN